MQVPQRCCFIHIALSIVWIWDTRRNSTATTSYVCTTVSSKSFRQILHCKHQQADFTFGLLPSAP